MDPFDEFEFKPLSEGLGFHRKTNSTKVAQTSNEDSIERSVTPPTTALREIQLNSEPPVLNSRTIVEQPVRRIEMNRAPEVVRSKILGAATPTESPKDKGLEITKPLPRLGDRKKLDIPFVHDKASPGFIESSKATAVNLPKFRSGGLKKMSAADVLQQQVQPQIDKASPEIPLNPPFPNSPEETPRVGVKTDTVGKPMFKQSLAGRRSPRGLQKAPVNLMALMLDAVVTVALTMLFVAGLLFVTKINFLSILREGSQDVMMQISLLSLVIAVVGIYMVVSRSFFGATLGEWAFNIQLGDEKQQASLYYPVRVCYRALLNLLTGLVTLPLLSAIFRKDIAGVVTGLYLFKY